MTLDEKLELKGIFNKILMFSQANPKNGGMQYAASYAAAGQTLGGSYELKIQTNYVLANLQTWRGEEARTSKKRMKNLCGIGG